jgi:hypothetical protein
MESILEDLPVKKEPAGFTSFFEKSVEVTEEIVEPQEQEPSIEEISSDAEVNPEILESESPVPPPEPTAIEESPIPDISESKAQEEVEVEEVAPQTEVVFEQVEGPKVEVISVKDEVQKIVVHLAPDKILEIDCEY